MHNIVHNMATEDVPVSNHLTSRKGVFQYVRRVPEDLRDAFPFARVQKSLRTRDKRAARADALALDEVWDAHFAEARRRKGLSPGPEGPAALVAEGWTWPDWQALASWFGASLAEEDWRARLGSMPGATFTAERDLSRLPWRDPAVVKEHIARGRTLRGGTVSDYAEARLPFVQGYVRRLGVSLSRTNPDLERFMAACLTAELAYLDVFQLREARRGGFDHIHPDAVDGPWKRLAGRPGVHPEPQARPAAVDSEVGRSLADCRTKWVENRRKAKKQARPDYLREMDQTIAAFEAHAGIRDIGLVRRRHLLAYRDHLGTATAYKTATINKKIGFISGLMATAANAGWIETGLGPDLYLEVPEDEDRREPYGDTELAAIFTHPVFTQGKRLTSVKACGELQFWLPLIACLHGMISSEILQLGPDTVGPHPDHPEILCFNVTNAGERAVKTLARRRWVPVRRELIDLGLPALVAEARQDGRKSLWSAMEAQAGDVTRVSGYFSSFWAAFSRGELNLTTEGTSLYSFRHGFQDRLGSAGYGEEVKKGLMGHAESGMTGRYGTKKKPRAVNVVELNEAIQRLPWPFLAGVRGEARPSGMRIAGRAAAATLA
ncbi:DUF6538 domain-containing protein [Methylorubrum zatmanii]|uniref:DUF6538 domain-containing protein n=1 Tax=Methylorubrum zatmanii TaxID=29429 RepID=A0ABW1WKU5_9HYPH|nr:DUF6538 domain-containing protein [Methylorubrum zatmanii]MBD8906928.1 hypothetical protein [Methylorubrum zatmanii]